MIKVVKKMSIASINLYSFLNSNPELVLYDGVHFNKLFDFEKAECFLLIQALFTQSRTRINRPEYTYINGDGETQDKSKALSPNKITFKTSKKWPEGFLPSQRSELSYADVAKYLFKASDAAKEYYRKNSLCIAQEIICTLYNVNPDALNYENKNYDSLSIIQQHDLLLVLQSLYNDTLQTGHSINPANLKLHGSLFPKHHSIKTDRLYTFTEIKDKLNTLHHRNNAYLCFLSYP